MPKTDLAKLDNGKLDRIDQISTADLLHAGARGIRQELMIAEAMEEMRQLLTEDILKSVMALQNSPVGFLTDKDSGYPQAVVRDVLIEATIRGFRMVNNEINIIAGRLYVTKEGLERKLAEYPGLSDLKFREGVPHTKHDGALVEYHATWRLGNIPDEIHCEEKDGSDTRIAVRVNKGMGVDAILGKARRKMLARIYSRLTGSEPYADPEDSETTETVKGALSEQSPAQGSLI